MPVDHRLGISDEVADVIDQQPGASIKEIVPVSVRPGWSITLNGNRRKRVVHIRFLRSVREDAFRAQERHLKGVIKYIALTELPTPLSSGERFIAIRERQDRTLSRTLPKLQGVEAPNATTLRTLVLRNVISGISSLHSVKAVHGDIKPDNIALSKSGERVELMDFGSPIPARQLNDNEYAYRGPGTLGTYSSDIFSFGALIHDLTNDLRLSFVFDQIGFSIRQLLWLSEVARWESARDRPDAETLFAVLFDRRSLLLGTREHVADAGNDLLRLMNRYNSNPVSFATLHVAKELVTARAIKSFEAHPETLVYAQRGKGLMSLLANVSVDTELPLPHTRQHEDTSVMPGEYVANSQSTIDDDFRRLIEHDLRRHYDESDPDAFRAELSEATAFFEGLRTQLLSESHYFGEEELAARMSWPDELQVSPAEVGTLRQWGALIAVRDHGKWLYPDFQFDPAVAAPYAVIRDVSERFVSDESPWAILSWWLSPHPRLNGVTPADALRDEGLRHSLPLLVAAAS